MSMTIMHIAAVIGCGGRETPSQPLSAPGGFVVARTMRDKAEVKMDRRAAKDRRSSNDRRQKDVPVKVERRKLERRAKVNRRRQIDPTTCERDYSGEEIEFMQALDAYKRSSGRMFPTCSEILEVIRDLGYQKLPRTDEPDATAETADTTDPTAPISEQPGANVRDEA
jgi:hypothetical protein